MIETCIEPSTHPPPSAIAAGRLHLSAVVLLAPHLTEGTAEELLAAATHKTKAEIERLLAERFPQADVLAWVEAMPAPPATGMDGPGTRPEGQQLSPGIVDERELIPEPVGEPRAQAPGPVGDHTRVRPLALQRFAVQFTMSQAAHDKLRHAQDLLGHQVPAADLPAVIELALDALILQLEKRKFAATDHSSRGPRRDTAGLRHIPAHVKRAVWERDEGRCTFVGESGRRCAARRGLEFDHVREVARGGEATVSGIRLRCRAHNQFEAECTFGSEFMRHKRLAAAERRAPAGTRSRAADRAQAAPESIATARAAAAAQAVAAERTAAADRAQRLDVVPWLKQLGFDATEAHQAAGPALRR